MSKLKRRERICSDDTSNARDAVPDSTTNELLHVFYAAIGKITTGEDLEQAAAREVERIAAAAPDDAPLAPHVRDASAWSKFAMRSAES